MTPSEFYNAYGRPAVISFTMGAGATEDIEADPDRYLLAFWGASASLTISPSGNGDETFNGFVMNATTAPILLSYALHGTLPTLAWRIQTSGVGANVCVMLGTMERNTANISSRPRGN